ncbi:hypothetical protein BDZ89DRAFT_1166350 [Hymenopellis radicata]|nr:hypothetical protein BDZ89DRAFT_1166350 [Hymenopellis radicata]
MTASPQSAFWTVCTGAECSCANHNIPSFNVPNSTTVLSTTPAFLRLLTTNDFPSPAEEATIRAAILDLDAQLGVASDLTSNINLLRTLNSEQKTHIDMLLPEIKESADLLTSALDSHKKLLSPIRRIPPEVLCHIFSFTVEYPFRPWSMSKPHNTLWTLELVCKKWRQQVLSYPQLLSQITVVFGKKDYSSIEKKPVLRLAEQLRRAGSAPLAVCLCRSPRNPGVKIPSSILLLLRPFISRIRELILHMPLHFISILNPLRGRLSSLRSLSIRRLRDVGTGTSTPTATQKIVAFEACSQLNAISIVEVPNILEWFVLPWKNIERVRTFHADLRWSNCPNMHDIVTSIQKTSQLRECHVCLQSPGARGPLQNVERVAYSQLTALSVQAVDTLISSFLDHISAPLLSHLAIKVCPPPSTTRKKLAPGDIPKACSRFIHQCKPPLVSLCIEDEVLASDSLVSILQAAPTLSEIDLKNCGGLTNKVIGSLAVIPGSPLASILGPHLRTLSISGQLDFDPDIFVEMVESRWEVYPFASIQLCWLATGNRKKALKRNEAALVAEYLELYCTLGLKLTVSVEDPEMDWAMDFSRRHLHCPCLEHL